MAKASESSPDLNIGKALVEAGAAAPISESDGLPRETAQDPALLRRLAAAEARILELKEENERIIAEAQASSGKRYSPKEKAFAGSEGYQFRVSPIPNKEHPERTAHLESKVIEACDESEALRWYCSAHESRPGSGQAVDPLRVRLEVKPVGRKRADSIMRQKQIGALRKKVEAGLNLNAKETELLATCEKEIFNY